ncbi:hypothetical protein ScPMuIL_008235 [Solemya velum]
MGSRLADDVLPEEVHHYPTFQRRKTVKIGYPAFGHTIESAPDSNTPPVITGLYPATIHKSEETATPFNSLMHQVTATDADGDPITFSYVFTPTSGSSMFTADTTTGAINLGSTYLDYEVVQQFDIFVTASDGTDVSQPVLVTISVDDVPEAPTLSATNFYFTVTEGGAGTIVGTPSVSISDEDFLESHTYIITGGSGQPYFQMDPLTGLITLATNYDIDAGVMPTLQTLDISILDKYGLSAVGTVDITITDLNDNTPVFSPATYSISAGISTPTGTTFTQVTATDSDSGVNAQLSYSVIDTQGSQYFDFSGTDLYLYHPIDVDLGNDWSFVIAVIDGGSPMLSGTARVTVATSSTTTSTTTTPSPPAYSWFDNKDNVIAFAILMVALAALLGLSIYFCWHWRTFGKCLPRFGDKPYDRARPVAPRQPIKHDPYTKPVKQDVIQDTPCSTPRQSRQQKSDGRVGTARHTLQCSQEFTQIRGSLQIDSVGIDEENNYMPILICAWGLYGPLDGLGRSSVACFGS